MAIQVRFKEVPRVRPFSHGLLLAGAVIGTFVAFGWEWVLGQQVHRNAFEARDPVWVKGSADAPFREMAHDMSEVTIHTGQHSEHLKLVAERGNFIHYFYPTNRAPVSAELSVNVWVKSNRPGIQLLARMVLPHEPNPTNLQERMTTLMSGDTYQVVSRWQRLELGHPAKTKLEMQQRMRAQLRRDVNFDDAYVDQLILNVYGGPGLTELWIDDLEVGPVLDDNPFQVASRAVQNPGSGLPTPPSRPANRPAVVEFRDHLMVNNRPFFMRGIRHSDTPLKTLKDAGFNTVYFDYTTPQPRLEEAVQLGFWLVPSLPVTMDDPRLSSAERLSQEVTRFLVGDAVLFWDLGGGLVKEQADQVAQAAQAIRGADPQRPLAADVWDGFRRYSLNLDLLGIHRWPLMTGLELAQYRTWLNQRRLLSRPQAFMWTWVQTHLPDWYTQLVYDQPAAAQFKEPIGPQPEQIRLLTYTALSAGCQGLGFWSDRFLADSHQGRDRLYELALLNLELKMLEPLLVTAQPPRWIDTSEANVKAAVLRGDRGILVLPIWLGQGSQFVPGQAASSKLTIDVPQVPNGTQAWLISPAEVKSLQSERVVGGMRIVLPEFSLTAAIVFTSDSSPTGILVRFQNLARENDFVAAQWSQQLAQLELEKVSQVEGQLEEMGHTPTSAQKLLENARLRLRACVGYWNDKRYAQSFAEAERVLRPLRILMRDQWDSATRGLDSPVCSPYAVSFFTLPRHWRFMEQIRQTTPAANALPDGGFEAGELGTNSPGWLRQEQTLDDVEMTARRVVDDPKEGKQCQMLQIKPLNAQNLPPEALERTFLAMNSPTVRYQPGSLVRISGWIRIPEAIKASADGALLFDSIGGEPLAIRLTEKTPWKKFTLYRRVPSSGTVGVTLALTGLGTVYFDDIQIQQLLPAGMAQRGTGL